MPDLTPIGALVDGLDSIYRPGELTKGTELHECLKCGSVYSWTRKTCRLCEVLAKLKIGDDV